MADQFGVSFLPGGDAKYSRQQNTGAVPLQEAIKVLSLRVPRVVGASPLAPLALLSGMGGGGMPSGVVETLLRALAPPAPETPPVAAMPEGVLPASEPQMASEPVPQPAPPVLPGQAGPVRPQVTGAMSGAPAPRPPAMPAFSSLPMPSVTAGMREETPETGYQPPPQPTLPNPSLTGDSFEDAIRRELDPEEYWRRGQMQRRGW